MQWVAGILCFAGSFVSYVSFDRRQEHMDFKRHQNASMGVRGITTLIIYVPREIHSPYTLNLSRRHEN